MQNDRQRRKGKPMRFEDLTPDQQEKAKACKSVDELLAIAKEEGYELSDDELEAVSGGDWDCWSVCSQLVDDPKCSMHGFVC